MPTTALGSLQASPLSKRVSAFRDFMIEELPRAPNNHPSRAALRAMPIRRLILHFVTWRLRLVPAKPRKVGVWSEGVQASELLAMRSRLQPLVDKIEAGKDLTSYLSNLVTTKGVVLPGADPDDQGKDIDGVLTRSGLHHFHLAQPGAKTGSRSGPLLFAEVLDTEFRIVVISDHTAFQHGSAEQARLFQICWTYVGRDVPAGQGFITNPVMSSGHAANVVFFSDYCEMQIEALDPRLDDPAYVDELYGLGPVSDDGSPIRRPSKPLLSWHFDDLRFGILDRRTKVFFCISPYFNR